MEEVGVGAVVATRCLLDTSKGAIVEKTSPGGEEPTESTIEGYRLEAGHRQPGFDCPSEQEEKVTL
jgi:hypothetical protein